MIASNLGFPRVGKNRELKTALEAYWSGKISETELISAAQIVRRGNWTVQKELGIDQIPSNDFSLYDHVLDTCVLVGAIPSRYGATGKTVSLQTYFAMARGSVQQKDLSAMEMTKWFDTNYHYIVPEFESNQSFSLSSTKPVDEYLEAKSLGIETRPVLLGPISFLLLGKAKSSDLIPLSLLDRLLPVYEEVLRKLADAGATWVQMDEPALVLELKKEVKEAYQLAYSRLAQGAPSLKILLATYFEGLHDNTETAFSLPIAGVHLDLVRGADQATRLFQSVPKNLTLSLGVVDGRNIWRTDLVKAQAVISAAIALLGEDRIMIAPSCSLLHVPVDLSGETKLPSEVKSWMAFATQKLSEVVALARQGETLAIATKESQAALATRQQSKLTFNQEVRERLSQVTPCMLERESHYEKREKAQQEKLGLPLYPTTTIGSFPQTKEVRAARAEFKSGKRTPEAYEQFLKEEIQRAVTFQEEINLDVLVHGEFERNDMVEYFGEQLSGFVFTQNGWVQSYGSRCVKPPIIFGDVTRINPMTVKWTTYAQSLTKRQMKGMLTGPVTILKWSFVRDDQPLSATCQQIGLAIRDEVRDLEAAGISIIQIDEPAIREGMPLRQEEWAGYLAWAVDAFRLATAGVKDATQIHTHMCYSEFNDILEAIGKMDADVISIETSRSQMELLGAFKNFCYPNAIGPGVYDIHSPRVPTVGEMDDLLKRALAVLNPTQIWVNPDCGLKTRGWEEVRLSLVAMVQSATNLRKQNG